ncbi:hypothetical protein B0H34DRAFT_10093 [Crassisporium funariophilum]|nr:hypothetical protein B0H34DRAFT_10093 [Crassisporium funariophilum]
MSSTGVPDLNSTFGALQIGSLLSVFLFGIVSLQTHQYFTNFEQDKRLFKTLVIVIWLLELAHTIGVTYEVYRATIVFYGRLETVVRFPGLGVVTLLGGLITMLVQLFFSLRVWKVLPSPYRYIGLVCMVAAATRCIASIFLGCQAIIAPSITEYRIRWKWLITTLLTVGAAIDITIAVSMLYFLIKRRDSELNKGPRLIDRLVAYTIRTGLFTSVSAVAMVISFQLLPSTLIWLAMYTTLAKLYSNSLLSALNERRGLRIAVTGSSSAELSRGAKSTRPEPGDPARMSLNPYQIAIEMRTTTEVSGDEDKLFMNDESSRPDSPRSLSKAYQPYGNRSPLTAVNFAYPDSARPHSFSPDDKSFYHAV